jgi:hypothetical protein
VAVAPEGLRPYLEDVMPRWIRLPFGPLMAVLLMAMIALQATPAEPIPQALDGGPAFSASSIEVALAPRRGLAGETRLAPVPLPARPLQQLTPVATLALTEQAWPAHRQTGPPPPVPRRTLASPREPPLT